MAEPKIQIKFNIGTVKYLCLVYSKVTEDFPSCFSEDTVFLCLYFFGKEAPIISKQTMVSSSLHNHWGDDSHKLGESITLQW